MNLSNEKNCDNCIYFNWYYDWCELWDKDTDGREVHECFAESKPVCTNESSITIRQL